MSEAAGPVEILAAHRYFWPDVTPYATILKDIATAWSQAGAAVTVVSTKPGYRSDSPPAPTHERIGSFTAFRIPVLPERSWRSWVRVLNGLIFTVGFFGVALARRPDVLMVTTIPPPFLGYAGRLAARLCGAKLVYHCLDIHPEAARFASVLEDSRGYGMLRAIDTSTCQAADAVVVPSGDMARALVEREPTEFLSLAIINNYALLGPEDETGGPATVDEERRMRLVFAGNLGRYQGLDLIVDAFADVTRTGEADLELWFVGDGVARPALEAKVAEFGLGERVTFFGHRPLREATRLIRSCDLGIVSLQREIYRFAYPSKTFTYLEAGVPVLAIIEPHSELGDLVRSCELGYVNAQDDRSGLARILGRLGAERGRLVRMANNARRVSTDSLGKQAILGRWLDLLRALES